MGYRLTIDQIKREYLQTYYAQVKRDGTATLEQESQVFQTAETSWMMKVRKWTVTMGDTGWSNEKIDFANV
jgi:hypothetical protein